MKIISKEKSWRNDAKHCNCGFIFSFQKMLLPTQVSCWALNIHNTVILNYLFSFAIIDHEFRISILHLTDEFTMSFHFTPIPNCQPFLFRSAKRKQERKKITLHSNEKPTTKICEFHWIKRRKKPFIIYRCAINAQNMHFSYKKMSEM